MLNTSIQSEYSYPLAIIFTAYPSLASAESTAHEASEWDIEDIVYLHWRLLLELRCLADPRSPLQEKLDTLRWVFTEPDNDTRPFSMANCVKVVTCSPLSPLPFIGRLEVEDIRSWIRSQLPQWLGASLEAFPGWIRDALRQHPDWVQRQLDANPQWINEQIRAARLHGDLFAIPEART